MKDRTTIQLSEDLRKELRLLAAKRDISYQELLKDMVDVFRELDRSKTIISVPKQLSKKVEENIKGSDMSSVSEYVTFLLRMVLSEQSGVYSKKEEAKIKQRLKKLGYL